MSSVDLGLPVQVKYETGTDTRCTPTRKRAISAQYYPWADSTTAWYKRRPIVLRAPYAVSSTDLGYAATRSTRKCVGKSALSRVGPYSIFLRAPYAVFGTDLGYAATVLPTRPEHPRGGEGRAAAAVPGTLAPYALATTSP
eukprot:3862471-Rhodomonas_salina.1